VGVGFGGNDTMDNALFRNNLAFGGPADYSTGFYGTGNPYAAEMKSPGKNSDFDYDAVGSYETPYKALIGSQLFSQVEKHGISDISFGSTFDNIPFPLDFKKQYRAPVLGLKESSAAIDAGEVIANINEPYVGKAPDIGALESGAPLPVYGITRYYVAPAANVAFSTGKLFIGEENLDSPKFGALVRKYRLDTVVKDEHDELKRIVLLREWIRSKIKIDNEGPFPGDGSAESILDEAIRGHGFHCAHYSLVQQAVMNAFGYVTRFVRVDDGGVENGEGHHAVNEIWLNSFGKWFMSDAKYNYHFEKNDVPLSALEIHDEYLRNGAKDIVMVRGKDRRIIQYDTLMKRNTAQFARIYSWISWSKTNNDYSGWPGSDSRLLVYGDNYFMSHTWMRNGKPHWAYNTPYFDTVISKRSIEWTPNVVNANCAFRNDSAIITLTSETPNLLRYEMSLSVGGNWSEVVPVIPVKLEGDRDFYFRAVNKAGIAGPRYYLPIRLHPAFDSLRVIEQRDVKVTMRDGVNLSTNIFLPSKDARFPVLLLRTPYDKGESGRHGEYFFVKHGYAIVVQDCRGRYASQGKFDPFQHEANDGVDVRQWIGQQTWCNGNIITIGSSYEGVTQWLPAFASTQFLRGMYTSKTFGDLYDQVYYGGAFRILRFFPWGWQMTNPVSMYHEIARAKMDSAYASIPLISSDEKIGWRVNFLRDWLSHPAKDAYWKNVSGIKNYPGTVPTYNLAGWFDSFLQGTIDNYMHAKKTTGNNGIKHILVIGPWIHGNEQSKTGLLDFGETAVFDERSEQLKFFSSVLGEKSATDSLSQFPVRIFVMGANKWRYEHEWPLERAVYTKFYLAGHNANSINGNGMLDRTVPSTTTIDTFTYDPLHPVPNKGNLQPVDQKEIEQRADVLVYTSGVLEKDMEVTGPLSAVIYASSSAMSTDFTAKIADVYPDGRAINLREGIIRSGFREPRVKPAAIVPGKVYEYKINLWSLSNVFLKGHRIRVEISSSNFPMFDRNLNTGLNPALSTTVKKARQKIFHGKKYPSHILLPLIP
jgi:putative CocE/NonD family hydrolase